jgi:tRNA-intron endonuclease
MIGTLEGDTISIPGGDSLFNRGYGTKEGNRLILDLFEGVYLLKKKRIKVNVHGNTIQNTEHLFKIASDLIPDFEIRYFVYEDIRDRGIKIKPEKHNFLVYPRGAKKKFLKPEFHVYAVSERFRMKYSEIENMMDRAINDGLTLIIAVVDQEGEITYYQISPEIVSGKMGEISQKPVDGILSGDRVLVFGDKGRWLFDKFFFGSDKGEVIQISLMEALYLMEKKVLNLNVNVSPENFRKFAEHIEQDFSAKYKVYCMCRDSGMVIKTGFKFGSDFRAYEKIDKVEQLPHSKYLINVVSPSDEVYFPEMACSVRLAHNVRKLMLYALVEGSHIRFINISRVRI